MQHENLVENSSTNLVGNTVGNLLENSVGNSAGNLMGKYSFLKPILNGFSHMAHQIEAENLTYKIKKFSKF